MLAFITGSGFYDLPGLTDRVERRVSTRYGEVDLLSGRLVGRAVAFLARHGRGHTIAPHRINYRANIAALDEIGATAVIATAVSGAIDPAMQPGDLVLIDQFLEFTKGRIDTFHDEDADSGVVHTDLTEPYDPALRAVLEVAAEGLGIAVHGRGTYVCTNGPRFETPAEIRAFATLGGQLVGMTGYPEVALAAEAGIPYASIGVISNPAAGLAGDAVISIEEIMATLDEARGPVLRLFEAVAVAWMPSPDGAS